MRSALGEFGVLVDVVLFALGRTDTPPRTGFGHRELAALVLSTQASKALDEGDRAAGARRLLDQAADSRETCPSRCAACCSARPASIAAHGGSPDAYRRFETALRPSTVPTVCGWPARSCTSTWPGCCTSRPADRPDLLNRAIPHYHSALQLVLREEAPLLWASAHANLATAYLTMPMTEASGQLRLGVAAQSLRSALKVYTREDYPEQWASVQLNLANSLVYTPSSHQADNLVEAVELYEAVLEARDRDTDPLGRARVLANQGNVLAHLGVFDQAKAKLYEARFMFEEFGDHDAMRTVRGVLDEIARQQPP